MALFQDLDTLNGKCSVNYSLSCYFIKQPFIIQQWNFIHVFSIKTYGNSWSSITLTCILTTLCSFVKYTGTLFLLHNDNIQILVFWGKKVLWFDVIESTCDCWSNIHTFGTHEVFLFQTKRTKWQKSWGMRKWNRKNWFVTNFKSS